MKNIDNANLLEAIEHIKSMLSTNKEPPKETTKQKIARFKKEYKNLKFR